MRALAVALPAAAVAALLVDPTPAEAGLTLHGSVGITYVLTGGGGVTPDRGPLTFELGPGYDIEKLVRIEVPIVLGAFGSVPFPPQSNGFLGVRPSVKLYPFNALYAKAAAQLFFPDGEAYLGVAFGGGVEFTMGGVFSINGEITFNPFFEPATALPLEFRAGVNFLF